MIAPAPTTDALDYDEMRRQQLQKDPFALQVKDGCCPLCGIQLYQWKRSKKHPIFGRRRLVPIDSDDGKVVDGHCLACEYQDQLRQEAQQKQQQQSTSTTTSTESDDFVYEGEYNLYGQRHGPGEIIWSDGDRYVGNFFNGTRDGVGTLFLRDGKQSS